MKKVTCITLTIVLLIFSAAPAVATTYYASDPVYVTTSSPNDTVTQSEILWGVQGTHDATITAAIVKLQLQSGDQVSVNWCDSDGDTFDTDSVNTGSSTVNLTPPSGAYGASLVLTSSSAAGDRWAWWNSATNSQGNTTIFPDPNTGSGGDPGDPIDLSPVVNALQTIQGQLTGIQGQLTTLAGGSGGVSNSDIVTAIQDQTDAIGSQIDDMSGQISGHLNDVKGKLDDIDSGIVDIYDYISTPRTSQPTTNNLPDISFSPTPPDISEPYQQPYEYNRPAPQVQPFVDSPGPLPIAPDPVVMEHDPATETDQPLLVEQPITPDQVTVDTPREQDPVTIETPREQDPVSRENPISQDPVTKEAPRVKDTPIQAEQPVGRDQPITPEPPLEPDPPR